MSLTSLFILATSIGGLCYLLHRQRRQTPSTTSLVTPYSPPENLTLSDLRAGYTLNYAPPPWLLDTQLPTTRSTWTVLEESDLSLGPLHFGKEWVLTDGTSRIRFFEEEGSENPPVRTALALNTSGEIPGETPESAREPHTEPATQLILNDGSVFSLRRALSGSRAKSEQPMEMSPVFFWEYQGPGPRVLQLEQTEDGSRRIWRGVRITPEEVTHLRGGEE